MLGQFTVLELLKGWEYKGHVATRRTVVRGADPIEVLRLDETGMLTQIQEATTDTYGTLIVEYQGADLETKSYHLYPEAANAVGAFAQDPGGWLQKYFRPNPYSTAGIFFVAALSSGFHGSVYPYVPSVSVKLYLPNDSTQETAYISGVASVIAITDKEAFIHSLRRLQNPDASLDVDKALTAIGPYPFSEKEKR